MLTCKRITFRPPFFRISRSRVVRLSHRPYASRILQFYSSFREQRTRLRAFSCFTLPFSVVCLWAVFILLFTTRSDSFATPSFWKVGGTPLYSALVCMCGISLSVYNAKVSFGPIPLVWWHFDLFVPCSRFRKSRCRRCAFIDDLKRVILNLQWHVLVVSLSYYFVTSWSLFARIVL